MKDIHYHHNKFSHLNLMLDQINFQNFTLNRKKNHEMFHFPLNLPFQPSKNCVIF